MQWQHCNTLSGVAAWYDSVSNATHTCYDHSWKGNKVWRVCLHRRPVLIGIRLRAWSECTSECNLTGDLKKIVIQQPFKCFMYLPQSTASIRSQFQISTSTSNKWELLWHLLTMAGEEQGFHLTLAIKYSCEIPLTSKYCHDRKPNLMKQLTELSRMNFEVWWHDFAYINQLGKKRQLPLSLVKPDS